MRAVLASAAALAALALPGAASPEAQAASAGARPTPSAAAACGGQRPTALRFTRPAGRRSGRLTWRAPRRGRPAGYRVARNGAVVGQTRRRSMRVQVRPGRRYRFEVRPLASGGRAARCSARIVRRLRWHPPGAPLDLGLTPAGAGSVELTWRAGRRGDGRLAGYRVYRNGAVDRQVREPSATVSLRGAGQHELAVAAVDTRGRVGPLTAAVRASADHVPPGVPPGLAAGAVTDTSAALSWSAAGEGSARVVGYRVYRDGELLGQVGGLSHVVSGLAPASGYRFAVAAVDGSGYVGPESPPLGLTTAHPPPATGSVHAFLLASDGESFRDLQRNYRRIGTLYPTYYDCEPDGSISGADDPLVTGWARLRRIAVLPRINCQSQTRLHLILTDPAVRAAVLDRLTALGSSPSYEGLNIDFESGAATDRGALTSFVSELASRLHARGRRLAVEVSAKTQETTTGRSGFYDYRALGAAADTVFVMDWGIHWSTSAPGAIDDLPWATAVADYTATMPQRSKYVLGIGLYGFDWAAGGGPGHPGTPLEHADIVRLADEVGAAPAVDPTAASPHFSYTDAGGVGHDVWFQDAVSADLRIRLARERGLGVGFWRLGREDQRIWSNPLLP